MKGNKKVADYYPELVRFFKNPEEAEKYSIRSDKRVWVKCPDCGHEHVMIVKNLTRRHYRCPVCGDGNSFPEKLTLALLDLSGTEYVYHANNKTFPWCGKFIYDFYFPKENIIIETDGAQHSTDCFGFKGAKTLDDEQKNDILKEKLALENGISKVIRIDFRDSDLTICKRNLVNSLLGLIDFENINWRDVVAKASSSKLRSACEKWEKEKKTKDAAEIAKELGISRDKLVRFLHKGTEAGFCVYDGETERIRASKKGGDIIKKIRTKKILVYDLEDNFLGEYPGARYLAENSKKLFGVQFDYPGIIYTCTGEQKTHRNFKFKYKND